MWGSRTPAVWTQKRGFYSALLRERGLTWGLEVGDSEAGRRLSQNLEGVKMPQRNPLLCMLR